MFFIWCLILLFPCPGHKSTINQILTVCCLTVKHCVRHACQAGMHTHKVEHALLSRMVDIKWLSCSLFFHVLCTLQYNFVTCSETLQSWLNRPWLLSSYNSGPRWQGQRKENVWEWCIGLLEVQNLRHCRVTLGRLDKCFEISALLIWKIWSCLSYLPRFENQIVWYRGKLQKVNGKVELKDE